MKKGDPVVLPNGKYGTIEWVVKEYAVREFGAPPGEVEYYSENRLIPVIEAARAVEERDTA
jgi:hypothetical protein